MHLKSLRVTNYDPTKYRRSEEVLTISENEKASNEV